MTTRNTFVGADVDIDLADRTQLLDLIQSTPAQQLTEGQIRTHNSGVYVQDIPYDPVHGCASIDYQEAERRGYFKIDLLNMTVYRGVNGLEHLHTLLNTEPPWQRLWQEPSWASQLVHIGNYLELLNSMRPDSVPRMAAFISIIRPGKAHLQKQPWSEVFASVWDGDDSRGYTFKKSHAIGYATLVALHMNLLNSADQGN